MYAFDARDLVLDSQFASLEVVQIHVVGKRPGDFLRDFMLEQSMLGFQRLNPIIQRHCQPPCWGTVLRSSTLLSACLAGQQQGCLRPIDRASGGPRKAAEPASM